MYTKEKIIDTLKKYKDLYGKIDEIVELHGKKDALYYDIKEIEYGDLKDTLIIHVEYYKWQDTNEHTIYIDLELLTEESNLSQFKLEVEKAVDKRKQEESNELEEKKKKEIESALKILRENGVL